MVKSLEVYLSSVIPSWSRYGAMQGFELVVEVAVCVPSCVFGVMEGREERLEANEEGNLSEHS